MSVTRAVLPQRYHRICGCAEVGDPGSREFEISLLDETVSGFVLHWQGHWYAYRNSCPHTGVALNWMPDQFFDLTGEYVHCGMHGALFRPADGFCVRGPCVGRSLVSLPIELRAGEVVLDSEKLAAE
jgi:nitrite reductase/ring-hydroxylating ferredoxin subunit